MNTCDVAIIGGGPSGSTVASILRIYAPDLKVQIFERERFPRDHVGESLLPTINRVLAEIGVWDKIEAANFPIKIGATYRWGTSEDLWDFNLLATEEVDPNSPRPGEYKSWRQRSTFQVDRPVYDKILLENAAGLGAEVHEETAVRKVLNDGKSVTGLTLDSGETVTAKYYIDCSGNAGILRRALDVQCDEPPSLRNIAIWDHWNNAEWAVTIGIAATRIQIMSLGYGWLWFIPISPTRTSIGLVCPGEYYKASGKRPEELYLEAVRSQPRIAALVAKASREGKVSTTRDWSFVSQQMAGPNWFLVGECAGFADPILSAGLTLAHIGAKECAYTIMELERGEHDPEWLRGEFQARQAQRIEQHIKFANFWYAANRHFSELVDYTAEIAKEAGYDMDPQAAWQWIGSGGFVSLETAGPGLAGHSLEQIKNLATVMFKGESKWAITKYNMFDLKLTGAEVADYALYADGRIQKTKVYKRKGKILPVYGGFRVAIEALRREKKLGPIMRNIESLTQKVGRTGVLAALEALENMVHDGWVDASYRKDKPLLSLSDIPRTPNVDWNRDPELAHS
ncbi:MAG TPA: NAD(P)/FAD-dependent oxidoreductase [Fimbriimonas sp.]|nr:NAD(P)/FAD-dependent oxidoreductase [Fimbriimonas sp.]